jgi:hypothetical protein
LEQHQSVFWVSIGLAPVEHFWIEDRLLLLLRLPWFIAFLQLLLLDRLNFLLSQFHWVFVLPFCGILKFVGD